MSAGFTCGAGPLAGSSVASISRNACSMNRTTLGMSAWTTELG